MKTQRSLGYALLAGLVWVCALQGCKDDGDANDKPPTIVKPTGGSSHHEGGANDGGTGNVGDTGGSGKGGSAGKGGTAGNGGAPPERVGGAGGEGGAAEPTCPLPERGAKDCYNCPKNGETEQWLNRCSDSDCEPFDNSRLHLLKADGTLPDLP